MSESKFYTIEPYRPSTAPNFATAAMRECGICGVFVAGSGGGNLRNLCNACVTAIEARAMRRFVDRSALKAWGAEQETDNEVR